ncbi:MAG: corrinoid protein [Thermoanaerobaculales bacterium]|nr:corrinoid protein [Thermoanaerobaculales bacterium]
MDHLNEISESLQRGDHLRVAELTRKAIDGGTAATEILDRGLLAGMDVVGRRFGAHEIFLPEVLLAARAMKAGMDLVKPLLVSGNAPSRGKVVLGTVKGDVHDIGKNLVGIMLEGAGYEVIDLGTGVDAPTFVDTALAEGARLIGLSALLTTTMSAMREVVDLARSGEHDLKIIVGGAPLTQDFADAIGADGYSYDAAGAVALVKRLLEAA